MSGALPQCRSSMILLTQLCVDCMSSRKWHTLVPWHTRVAITKVIGEFIHNNIIVYTLVYLSTRGHFFQTLNAKFSKNFYRPCLEDLHGVH